MNRSKVFAVFSFALYAAATDVAIAEVKLHGLFTDAMVLQQGNKIPFWGTAADGEKVTVTLGEAKAEATAAGGKWRVDLPAMKAGGPHTVVVAGTNRIKLENVLIGEVWICSGQSNMEWRIDHSADAQKNIAEAKFPQIRLFTVPRERDPKPRTDVNGKWLECSPKTIPSFTAVGYHFGRHLHENLKVPVGLISTNVGGTASEEWTSREVLSANPAFAPRLKNGNSTTLYNAMLHPLAPYGIKGAIWYQGESNAGRAEQYRTMFPTMIKNWRDLWGQGDFPFLFVQLAPWRKIDPEPKESDWAELREAQTLTLKASPNTGMAVITDVGDEMDIHPRQKQPVGERLALAARKIAYGENIVASGPTFEKLTIQGNQAVVEFGSLGGGLMLKGDKPTGFAIAGADRKFYNAEAKLEGNTIIVSSDKVPAPVAVRFGWANFPVVNLFNKEGLPASPFRTDDFPLTTAGRK